MMDIILERYTDVQIARAKGVKMLIVDVDGVLTDGKIIYTEKGDEQKAFNVKDGQVIKHLRAQGIVVGVITGRKSALVERRCAELKLDFCFQRVSDKYAVYQGVMKEYDLEAEQVAYIGDDIIDLKVIVNAGLGIAPADAVSYVKSRADLVTECGGGAGVLREAADFILAAQGHLERIVNDYLK